MGSGDDVPLLDKASSCSLHGEEMGRNEGPVCVCVWAAAGTPGLWLYMAIHDYTRRTRLDPLKNQSPGKMAPGLLCFRADDVLR